jgi:hypothetical protein
MAERAKPTINFDDLWEDERQEPFMVRIKGTDYEVPPAIPAKLILIATRLSKTQSKKSEAAPEVLLEMGEVIFGKKNLDKMLAEEISFDHLGRVLEMVQQEYARRAQANSGASDPKEAKRD